MTAAGAIALIPEVSDDAHVAETMTARGEEGDVDDLHAYRAEEVLIQLGSTRSHFGDGRGGGVGNHGSIDRRSRHRHRRGRGRNRRGWGSGSGGIVLDGRDEGAGGDLVHGQQR